MCDLGIRFSTTSKWSIDRYLSVEKTINVPKLRTPDTQSRFRPRITTIHPDLSQMVKSGWIGMLRDGKKIQHQYDVSECSYGVCAIHLRIHYDS